MPDETHFFAWMTFMAWPTRSTGLDHWYGLRGGARKRDMERDWDQLPIIPYPSDPPYLSDSINATIQALQYGSLLYSSLDRLLRLA